jgi:hypothetical protein
MDADKRRFSWILSASIRVHLRLIFFQPTNIGQIQNWMLDTRC